MDSKLEKAVHNFVFTHKFLEIVKKAEYRNKDKKKNPASHGNGVPLQYMLVFQLLCLMQDKEMSTENIKENYHNIFGRGINTSSLSRTLTYLSETLNLVQYVDNPFGDARYRWLGLTYIGKRLQEYLIGSTDIKAPIVFNNPTLKTGTGR
tara:strand:- start:1873 stop:2322 length:450 start_codon:yes stop_codon:yes gene_type:complete